MSPVAAVILATPPPSPKLSCTTASFCRPTVPSRPLVCRWRSSLTVDAGAERRQIELPRRPLTPQPQVSLLAHGEGAVVATAQPVARAVPLTCWRISGAAGRPTWALAPALLDVERHDPVGRAIAVDGGRIDELQPAYSPWTPGCLSRRLHRDRRREAAVEARRIGESDDVLVGAEDVAIGRLWRRRDRRSRRTTSTLPAVSPAQVSTPCRPGSRCRLAGREVFLASYSLRCSRRRTRLPCPYGRPTGRKRCSTPRRR